MSGPARQTASGERTDPIPAGAQRVAGDPAVPVSRDRLVIVLVYTLGWGALLLNRGFFWDDWTLVGLSPAELTRAFSELGLPWIGYVYVALFATPLPGLLGHAIIFGAYLLSTLVFHAILCRVPGLLRMDALVAALAFAVMPVNYARVALIDLTYAVSLLAFLAATWLLLRYVADGGRVRRVGALALYAYSFTTASLLVLYAVPLLVATAVARASTGRSLATIGLRHLDFLALPVAFWLLRSLFLRPSGVYEGYNALTLAGLARVPSLMVEIPRQVLLDPLARAAGAAGVVGLLAGAALAGWLLWRSRAAETSGSVETSGSLESGQSVPTLALALAGVVVLALGVFAYLTVGRIPTLYDWSSRHQLLVPIGAGLLAAALARGVAAAGPVGRAAGIVAVGIVLGMSGVADARTLKAYQADWYKQAALIQWARQLPELKEARHIRVIDDATAFNTLRRTYRFYEYNALFSEALGDTRRLASLPDREPTPEELQDFIARPTYHMGQYVPSPVDLELRIEEADGVPDTLDVLRLIVAEATGSPAFDQDVARLIAVEVTAVP